MDIDSVELGVEPVEILDTHSERTDTVIVMIPRNWPAWVVPKTSNAFPNHIVLIRGNRSKKIPLFDKKNAPKKRRKKETNSQVTEEEKTL